MCPKKNTSYQKALATGSFARRTDRPTEGGPVILHPPRERHVGIPGGAVDARGDQVPVVGRRIVDVVRRPHIRSTLRGRRRRGRAEQEHREETLSSDYNHRCGCWI